MTEKGQENQGDLPGKPRRADPRHSLKRAVKLRCSQWGSYIKLYTKNISRGGMLVRVPEPVDVGTQVQLKLTLPDASELFLRGKVARVVPPSGAETLHAVGVALDVTDEQRTKLDWYLSVAMATQPQDDTSDKGQAAPTLAEQAMEAQARAQPPVQLQERRSSAIPHTKSKGLVVTATKRIAKSDDTIIGIDFGTSTCSVGVIDGANLRLIKEHGETTIPSMVWFRGKNDYVVGKEAYENLPVDPTRTLHSIKRLLGATIHDRMAAPFLMSLACPGKIGPNDSIIFEINGEEFLPVQIAAIILRHLVNLAEKQLDKPVKKAVMAFPVAFGEHQRVALEKVAKIAGVELVALIPEPAAAALAYGRGVKNDETVGIYDFGGGTFDFCVLEVKREKALKVLGAAGDPWLGGDDMDQVLANAVAEEFRRATGVDVRHRVVEWQRVLQASEEAKRYLSMVEAIDVVVPALINSPEGPVDLSVPVSQENFEEMTAELIDLTLEICEQAVKEANISLDNLSDILLIGGSSRIPAVYKAVRMIFRREPRSALHPEQAVVAGAAIKAAEIEGRSSEGVWPSLSLEQVAGRTVGLAMASGMTEPVIRRSTSLPALARRIFATSRDGQTSLTLLVVEGESPLTVENRLVGQFNVTGLKPEPAGSIEIEVTFEMNDSGALSITARNLSTGQRTTNHFELMSRS